MRPQPTRLRALRGNPGRRPYNAAEPVPAPLAAAECPAELVDPVSRAEWDRVAPGLVACGMVTAADRATLIGYCSQYGQWQAAERAAAGKWFVKTGRGTPKPNPVLMLAHKAYTLMLKSAIELGMTPSARSRVVAVPLSSAPVSKWAGLK